MKNLSTVLMVLAASGSYVTALPTRPTRTYGAISALEGRDPTEPGLSQPGDIVLTIEANRSKIYESDISIIRDGHSLISCPVQRARPMQVPALLVARVLS